MLPRMQNQCFQRSSPSLLLSFFPDIRGCFLRKKESYPLNFPSFVCRALFPVRMVGVLRLSLTFLWKLGSAPCEWLAIPTQPNLPSSSSLLFFFACFLMFLKKAFPERKIALEIFPKKDEGALQITVQSMTKATFETVGQVRKAIFACLTTD